MTMNMSHEKLFSWMNAIELTPAGIFSVMIAADMIQPGSAERLMGSILAYHEGILAAPFIIGMSLLFLSFFLGTSAFVAEKFRGR